MSTTKLAKSANCSATTVAPTTTTTLTKPKLPLLLGKYSELELQQREHIAIITLNRTAVRNALTRRGYYELIRALREATLNDKITTIVLTGAAGCFTAGADLTRLSEYPDKQTYLRSSNNVLEMLVKAFLYCPKVLVALVDGACIGIGFVLVALCDVVYCTERAYFQAPFTQLGLCPEGCLSYLLPQLLGRVKAAELLLFGTRLSAEDALRFNLVARIVPAAEWEPQLWPQLALHARLPVESLRATKRLLSGAVKEELLRALQAECHELERLRLGETYERAIKAFVERKEVVRSEKNKSKL